MSNRFTPVRVIDCNSPATTRDEYIRAYEAQHGGKPYGEMPSEDAIIAAGKKLEAGETVIIDAGRPNEPSLGLKCELKIS